MKPSGGSRHGLIPAILVGLIVLAVGCQEETPETKSGFNVPATDTSYAKGDVSVGKECQKPSDCPDGFGCFTQRGSSGPRCERGKAGELVSFEQTREALGIRCDPTEGKKVDDGRLYSFEFTVAEDARGFMMAPYVTEGNLRPVSLETPERTIDLRKDYRHHNARLSDFYSTAGFGGMGTYGEVALDWPMIVPYAPSYSDVLHAGGSYKLTVSADKTAPCFYLLNARGGTKLNLNVYLVGAKNLDAESAPGDPDLQEAIGRLRSTYQKVGLEIGKIRYRDLSYEIVRRYRSVGSLRQAQELTSFGRPPSGTREGHISLDVFLVEDLSLSSAGSANALGVSAGLPGSIGLHGNARDGLVFEGADLGHANKHVGDVMAHEIGHFLGLRHTTEFVHGSSGGKKLDELVGSTDPIEDTPVCKNILSKVRNDPTKCPDFKNLMFPMAPPPDVRSSTTLTTGQGDALRANPAFVP